MTSSDPGDRARRAVQRATRTLDHPLGSASLRERLGELVARADDLVDLDATVDVYGGGVVAELERRVAELLGTPDALFFPTGTMAQQVALRCWAQRSGRRTVALHALSHPQVHEADALVRVAGLEPVHVTTAPRPVSGADVRALPEPVGTLMLELPLRDAGFLLPTWEELLDVVAAARERGAAVHLDGARLWESTTHLGRELSEIAGLADSVYVSFYKSLRGLSGAALAGPSDLVDQARLWRHRYGGNVFQQFPAVLSALDGLERERPRLPGYVAHARRVAAALAQELTVAGSAVHPPVPHTHQFQVWLPHPARVLDEAATRQAERSGTALFTRPWREPGRPPGTAYTEVTVTGPGLDWSEQDVRAAAREFLGLVATVAAEGLPAPESGNA